MSGRSGATASVRSCGSTRLGAAAGHELVLDALYDRKRDKKTVRVLTVIIYVFCVSLAAIMLSLYYVFFWEPKDAQYAQRKVLHKLERQASTAPTPTCFTPHTGGGGTKINGTNTTQPADNGVELTNTSAADEPATAPALSTETASTTAQDLYNSTSDDIGTLNETDIGTLNETDIGTLNETDNIT